jgi:hypothetical protein
MCIAGNSRKSERRLLCDENCALSNYQLIFITYLHSCHAWSFTMSPISQLLTTRFLAASVTYRTPTEMQDEILVASFSSESNPRVFSHSKQSFSRSAMI